MTLPEQLMRSQPATDLLAPATCTASFDPPQIGPGEKSIYRITFNAPEISIRRPASIPAPTPLHQRIASASLGAMVTVLLMNPLDVVKTRLQQQARGGAELPLPLPERLSLPRPAPFHALTTLHTPSAGLV